MGSIWHSLGLNCMEINPHTFLLQSLSLVIPIAYAYNKGDGKRQRGPKWISIWHLSHVIYSIENKPIVILFEKRKKHFNPSLNVWTFTLILEKCDNLKIILVFTFARVVYLFDSKVLCWQLQLLQRTLV
jgi:hypothetical protein